MRAIGWHVFSFMIPASTLMAVRVCDRASDWMCPRFFGIFRSSCFVSILTIRIALLCRTKAGAIKSVAELALKAGCGLVAPSLDDSTFRRAWGVSCCATAQPAELPHSHEDAPRWLVE